ncbi:MAG: dNTP triphosphohydrolase [Thermoplasmata archaeon]
MIVNKDDIRSDFARDRDKIIHSSAFFRLSGKTQVFMSPRNPLISSRMTHVIQVSQIAKSIARGIDANEDLTEAIALGHDLGHAPFGHSGEEILSKKCQEIGLPKFKHNVHSLRVVDVIEKNGCGLNLTWEVREGIICHDGEVKEGEIRPYLQRTVQEVEKYTPDDYKKPSSTIEGCIVKISDKIAYIGKDIEDAIEAGLLKKEELPKEYCDVLGYTNTEIINTLVQDIITNFHEDLDKFRKEHGRDPKRDEISIRLSPRVREAMDGLIFDFNYHKIYLSKTNKQYSAQTEAIISDVFDFFYKEAKSLKYAKQERALHTFGEIEETIPEALFKNLLATKTLSEVEETAKDIEKGFSEENFISLLPEKYKEKAKSFFETHTLAEVKKEILDALLKVKMEILQSNIEKWKRDQPRLPSILSFLNGKSGEYLIQTSVGEYVKDYVASLTDRTAIEIFKAIKIPESIV